MGVMNLFTGISPEDLLGAQGVIGGQAQSGTHMSCGPLARSVGR